MFTFVYNHYNMCSAVAAATATSVAAARFICFEAQKIFKLQILMKWLEIMEHLTAHNKIMLQHNIKMYTSNKQTHTHVDLMSWKPLFLSLFHLHSFCCCCCLLSLSLSPLHYTHKRSRAHISHFWQCEIIPNQKFQTKHLEHQHLFSWNIHQKMRSFAPLPLFLK